MGNVASSGRLWVSRDRVRLVHRADASGAGRATRGAARRALAATLRALRSFAGLCARRRPAEQPPLTPHYLST